MHQKLVQPPRLGQLVLVVDNSVRKSDWQLGKVIKQIKGKDDVVRAVKIQVMSQGKPLKLTILCKEYVRWRLMHQSRKKRRMKQRTIKITGLLSNLIDLRELLRLQVKSYESYRLTFKSRRLNLLIGGSVEKMPL